MKKLYIIISMGSLALSLSSCSYFDTQSGEDVKVEHYGASTNIGNRDYVTELPSSYARDVAVNTQGRVEVFPLENNQKTMDENIVVSTDLVVSQDGVVKVRKEDNGANAITSTPGVEIYPLGKSSLTHNSNVSLTHNQYQPPLVIYFDHNSTELDSSDLAQISRFATMFSSGFTPSLTVEGHASPQKSNSSTAALINMRISLRRANAVAKGLINAGVPAEKIKVQAFGDRRPTTSYNNSAKSTEAASRRVEVYIR